jgi:peptide-methionine (S)-S-oxide reductase
MMKTNRFALAGKLLGIGIAVALTAAFLSGASDATRQPVPAAAVDVAIAKNAGPQSAVFSGGCFWGVEAVFEHVKGVTNAVSGYAGGKSPNPSYEEVSTGDTGYAESVRVTWDPKQVSYGKLLQVFFSVAHDPTQLNFQGPDHGTQYRSALWTSDAEQAKVARAYIAQMTAAHTYGNAPIVTTVQPLSKFWPAEAYHQDFARLNPTHPYIVFHDAPKVAHLKERYPALYRPQWTVQLAGAPAKG